MADNYLERRMEDYRSGKLAASPRRRLTPSGARPGEFILRVEVRKVFIDISDYGLLEAVATACTGAGCRVAFTNADPGAGSRLAQKTGALYCPGSPSKSFSRVSERWEGMDVVVSDGLGDLPIPPANEPAREKTGITIYYCVEKRVAGEIIFPGENGAGEFAGQIAEGVMLAMSKKNESKRLLIKLYS